MILNTKITLSFAPFNSKSPFHLAALFQEFQANCKIKKKKKKEKKFGSALWFD